MNETGIKTVIPNPKPVKTVALVNNTVTPSQRLPCLRNSRVLTIAEQLLTLR